jgi:ketol-acid reductoisomerase
LRRAEQKGLLPALALNPLTAQYGTLNRLDRFDDLKLERLMEITLREIRDGVFAKEWRTEYGDGYPRLRKLMKQHSATDLWELEQQTLEMLGLNID